MIGRSKKAKPRRHIALQVVPEFYDRIAKHAAAQNRSITNMVKVALGEWLEAQENATGADSIPSPARPRGAATKKV